MFNDLGDDSYKRLAECRSTKSDIKYIALSYLRHLRISAEEAMVVALEHLDSNGQFFDLTEDEFDRMVAWIEKKGVR